jgi:F-type H+-transporting ATPase subunit delta
MNGEAIISLPARRYARALVEVGIKQGVFAAVIAELQAFHEQLKSVPLMQQLFLNPTVPPEKKKNVLQKMSSRQQMQPLTVNFLLTLMRRGRLNLLDQILISANQQFLEKQGITVIEVTTAKELRQEFRTRLIERLEKFTGKKVQLQNRIDPGLIGGMITRIGSTLYDGSVQAQLLQLKARIQED